MILTDNQNENCSISVLMSIFQKFSHTIMIISCFKCKIS